mmetsp:Transcript_183/g.725  ORF Transcript_183/g.725 Transcript_183/m.725 type:complete len:265 (-) Transcript_183:1046-1840(-)
MRETTVHSMYAAASLRMGAPHDAGAHSTPSKRSAPGGKRIRKCFMMGSKPSSGRQFRTNLSPTCISDSIARSFAIATVNPNGSNEACATHDATIALVAVPCAAVTTYKPPDTRPSARATSGDMALFIALSASFFVSTCPKSVPDSSNSWYVASVGASLTRSAGTTSARPSPANFTASVSTGSSAPPYDSPMRSFCFLLHEPTMAASASCAGPEVGGASSTMPAAPATASMSSCVSAVFMSIISTSTSALHSPRATLCDRRSEKP